MQQMKNTLTFLKKYNNKDYENRIFKKTQKRGQGIT